MKYVKNCFLGATHLVVVPLLLAALCARADASSYFGAAEYSSRSVDKRGSGDGQCLFFSGPHGDFLGDDEFLLLLLDEDFKDGPELAVKGTYERMASGRLVLHPDLQQLEDDIVALIERKFPDAPDFRLSVDEAFGVIKPDPRRGDEVVKCKFKAHGRFRGLGAVDRLPGGSPLRFGRPVSGRPNLMYVTAVGEGRHFTGGEGGTTASAPSDLGTVQESCPIPDLSAATNFCTTSDSRCLMPFSGYQWWTNYQFRGPPDYYYNNHQAWSPRNTWVDGEGLHLSVKMDDLGGGNVWAASEVVAMYQADGQTPAMLGYGTYLVSARIKSSGSWNDLDPNVAFGAFTYQKDKSGNADNPYRELDLAEISRWGVPQGGPCTGVLDPILCNGNAQFTLQLWNSLPGPVNINRYTIGSGVRDVTLVMEWTGPNTIVNFKQFNGILTYAQTQSQQPAYAWSSNDAQKPYVPANGCQRFHMNLWMGNFANDGTHPGPSNGVNQEVVVTNFEYHP